MKITNWKDCIRNRTKWVEEEEEEEEEDPQTYALAYGYIGARTDTTQETNICLGIHCRNAWLQKFWLEISVMVFFFSLVPKRRHTSNKFY